MGGVVLDTGCAGMTVRFLSRLPHRDGATATLMQIKPC
jgi:hypothetical protein